MKTRSRIPALITTAALVIIIAMFVGYRTGYQTATIDEINVLQSLNDGTSTAEAFYEATSTTPSAPIKSAPAISTEPITATPSANVVSVPNSQFKIYTNTELGFAITIPKNYRVYEMSNGVSIGAPATNSEPAMDITVSPALCTPDGRSMTNPTNYVRTTFNMTPKFAFDASGSNAVVIDRARVLSMKDTTANKGPGYPVYSSNIVGYQTFREMYIIRGCSMYTASYFVGDATFFDDALMTFSFPKQNPGILETQAVPAR